MGNALAAKQASNHTYQCLKTLAHGLCAEFFSFTVQRDEIKLFVTTHDFILSKTGAKSAPIAMSLCSDLHVVEILQNDEISFISPPMYSMHRLTYIKHNRVMQFGGICLMTNKVFNLLILFTAAKPNPPKTCLNIKANLLYPLKQKGHRRF
ncbi:hypothetical protein THS27_07435 [Thalassospira sp. MCCC 1A01428]|nr:hypothetical protein THS27_07435 [Thalassospira sp. MCCC 1A01428]